MTVFLTIIIIGILVLVHEWGHFITARRIGIPVYEFSIGFGYKLFSWRKNQVDYSIRLIPLGGFVRMAGEEAGDQEDPNGFNRRTPLEKIRVAFAGPFMNFVLALLIFIYSYAFIGIPHTNDEPVIGKVMQGNPADSAGLMAGDRVLSVDGVKIDSWMEFTRQLAGSEAGEPLTLEVVRDNNNLELQVVPQINSTSGVPAIGVLSDVYYEKQGLLNSVKIGLQQTYQLTVVLLSGLWVLVTGGASASDLAGPVGIAGLIGEAAQVGIVFLLSFVAFLSINLGILNLLPIPALDGSRIVFAIVEAIRKKPIEPEREGFIHWLGFMFLMGLILLVTFNDILRLIRG